MLKHVSTVAAEANIAERIAPPIQPEHCPYCNAVRAAVDGALHLFRCYTTIFIWQNKKPLVRRSRKCIEAEAAK